MQLYETIFVSLLIGIASSLLSKVLIALLHLVCHCVRITEQAQVSTLDRLLAETGWCSARFLGPGRLPADGIHFAFLRGPVFVVRCTESLSRGGSSISYSAYAVGRATVDALQAKLTGNARDVILRYVYAPAPWRTSTVSQRCAPPSKAHKWQSEIVRAVVKRYLTATHASVLVCGAPGLGKSTLGELIAAELMARTRMVPEVVKNLDLTARGLLLEDAYDSPTPTSPVILMLDEFDATVAHAERDQSGDGAREGTALADTPTSLLAVLDRLNRQSHLIVIATSNMGLDPLRKKYPRYVRDGRFDLRFPARSDQMGAFWLDARAESLHASRVNPCRWPRPQPQPRP